MDLGGENSSPILEEIEEEESLEAYSPPIITPLAQQGGLSLIQLVQQLEERGGGDHLQETLMRIIEEGGGTIPL
ncbi:unnamed protein product [Sphenostylis stenocarpa]|uniref:Uncharacterized protein n=1 Tax=Sphenostylis stenocarpa TaxID=92480 RepID=A0AA86S2N7_9FABA|nr:unnamed protein product [Sphenostylis stenocarpa]